MKRKSIFIVLVFLLPGVLLFSGCRQQRDIYAALDRLLFESVPADGPGVVMLVDAPGANELILKAGRADLDRNTAIQGRNHFRIGDITKTFVSTIIFQLVEEGELALDDVLTDHFPQSVTDNLPNTESITIRHLLNMSSGLADFRNNLAFQDAVVAEPTAPWLAEETLEFAYGQEVQGLPGEGYHYSNTNYILLQMLIEQVTGATLADEIVDRIIARLGIQDTYMEITGAAPGGYVPGYADLDGNGQLDNLILEGDARGLGDLGLISTVQDLAKFAPALYERSFTAENGRSESLATIDMGYGDAYGLGIMRRDSDWGDMWGHENWVLGYESQMWYLPEQEATIILLSNGLGNQKLTDLLSDALQIVLGVPAG